MKKSYKENPVKAVRRNPFYYLNFKNLSSEIEEYGYPFTWKKAFMAYFIAVSVMFCAGIVYKLAVPSIIFLIFLGVCMAPVILVNTYRSMYQQARFSEVNKYIEKMLYYFLNSGVILTSMKDLIKIFPKGPMHDSLFDAIDLIENGSGNTNLVEEALETISDRYPSERIKTLHNFMLSVERNGGDYKNSVDILLEDRTLWATRTVAAQNKKRIIHTNIIISIIFALLICIAILYVPQLVAKDIAAVDISRYGFVQASAVVFIVALMIIYVKADSKLAMDWLDLKEELNEEKVRNDYERIVNFKSEKEIKKSIPWFIGTLAVFATIFLFTKNLIAIAVGLIACIFMLNQHNIGHTLAKKAYIKNIEKAFPSWMMSVSLLMQHESPRMALRLSYDEAPVVLKPALEEMLLKLDEDPESMEAYENFLGYFNMSSVHDCMGTLYSISVGSGANLEAEFKNIMNQINIMMDKAETIKNDDKMAVFNSYIAFPAFAGAFKLMIDMTALLIAFLSFDFV